MVRQQGKDVGGTDVGPADKVLVRLALDAVRAQGVAVDRIAPDVGVLAEADEVVDLERVQLAPRPAERAVPDVDLDRVGGPPVEAELGGRPGDVLERREFGAVREREAGQVGVLGRRRRRLERGERLDGVRGEVAVAHEVKDLVLQRARRGATVSRGSQSAGRDGGKLGRRTNGIRCPGVFQPFSRTCAAMFSFISNGPTTAVLPAARAYARSMTSDTSWL